MPKASRAQSPFHSKDPAAAAWRAAQAHVDADIEGLSRDQNVDRMVSDMRAQGIEPRDRIKALISHFKARSTHTPAEP